MAYLLIRNPMTYIQLENNKINIFHGTNSEALPNVLKYGLNSVNESNKNNISVITGESWSRINGERSFISFTDVLDIAEDYSLYPTDAVEEQLSFPVIIGTSLEEVEKLDTCVVHSDVSEIGIKNKVPLENIKLIGVPSDKVEFVKKILNSDKIIVLGIDGIEERFYYIEDWGKINLQEEKLNKLRSDIKPKKGKIFKNQELKEVSISLMLKRVKDNINKIIYLNKVGEELNDNRPKHR